MNVDEQKRDNRLRLVEDHIGRSIAESEKTGELQAASSYGKPFSYGDGYQETPDKLRMGFKILKDAGVVPPEIELMQEIETLRLQLNNAPDTQQTKDGLLRLSEKRQQLAIQMEKLRSR